MLQTLMMHPFSFRSVLPSLAAPFFDISFYTLIANSNNPVRLSSMMRRNMDISKSVLPDLLTAGCEYPTPAQLTRPWIGFLTFCIYASMDSSELTSRNTN